MGAMTSPAERFAAAKLRGKHPLTIEFIEQFDFGFDDFQIAACQAVEDGKGVLVAAPTGAGKTNVALLTILRQVSEHVDINSEGPWDMTGKQF